MSKTSLPLGISQTCAWPGIITALVGAAGILLLIYLDRSNTHLQYDAWLQRGML